MAQVPTAAFTWGNLPREDEMARFERRNSRVMAVRVDGPFSVVGRDGEVRCDDGWLVVLTDGTPMALPDAEFRGQFWVTDDGRPTRILI